jgi:hypothetical protein
MVVRKFSFRSAYDMKTKLIARLVIYPAFVGASIGWISWGWSHSPMFAIWVIPLAYKLRSRWSVFFYAAGYHGATSGFLPNFASNWFHSSIAGIGLWAALTVLCAIFWAAAWTKSEKPETVFVVPVLAFVASTLPPIALVLCGSPLPAWGYAMQGFGWLGVAGALIGTGLLSVALRCKRLPILFPRCVPGLVDLSLFGLIATTLIVSMLQTRNDGRVLEHAVGVKTNWGSQPQTDFEVISRIEKIGKITRAMAGGDDDARLLVFPETILGRYDASFDAVLDREVVRPAKQAGQFVIVGMDRLNPDGRTLSNAAMLIRPDGTVQIVGQRQPSPVSMWRPWSEQGHYPADWLSNNVVELVPGFSARVMFCYEEYLPILHLINEAKDSHQLIVSIANLWAAEGSAASNTQAALTEGMALMFGRPFLRSENGPPVSGR